MLKKVIKEPLVHFLLAGFLLFIFFGNFSSSAYSEDDHTIVVNKDALLTMMQYRSKAFKGDYFEEKLDNLTEKDRNQLINDYIKEEALYREAQQLNLAQDDYIIKRRMIQKVDFIYENRIEENLSFPEDSLQQYFAENKNQYRTVALFTFSHIFFKTGNDEFSTAFQRANSFLKTNNTNLISFQESLPYGDRFLYHRHYVEKDLAHIASHFDAEFADTLAALSVNEKNWYGPIPSKHGYHLVLLSQKKEGNLPTFEQLKSTIVEDYKRLFERKLKEELIKEVIAQYKVIIDL